MKKYVEIIQNYLKENEEKLIKLSHQIHQNPETSNKEYFACEVLTNLLKEAEFDVEINIAGHETGFIAKKKSSKGGAKIGLLAEYDALEGLGHGCGHNIIGVTSCGAAIALSKVIEDVGGEIIVFGTPAEEGGDNGGAKVSFINEGVFDGVDVCMMIHPSNKTSITVESLAFHGIDFEFFGKPAHAAASPEAGINALDAMILFYNGINALRQQVTPDVRIHGIITNGGEAPNIIPDYTKARFYIRADKIKNCDTVAERVIKVAEGAAISTGCTFKHTYYEHSLEDMIVYPYFNQIFLDIATDMGIEMSKTEKGKGSTDTGNVSHIMPTIHPYLKICDENIVGHTEEFKQAAISKDGDKALLKGAEILAKIGLELLTDDEKLQKVKKEFEEINK